MATREIETGGNYSFKEDLKSSYVVERAFGALLEKRADVTSVSYNDNYKYDLKVKKKNGQELTLEVKNDMMSAKTGNIGVEFECRGSSSGIATSLAQFWVFKLSDGFWMINSKNLKKLIEEKQYHRIGVGGDAGSNTKMYLFKADLLKPLMKKYD